MKNSSSEIQLSKGERTRKRIVEIAETMFATRGYEATSLRDIAREVPIQQPGLYNYFETKDDLYGAVIELVFARMLGSLAEFSQEQGATDRVAELPIRALRYQAEHPLAAKLLYRELLSDEIHPVMYKWLRQLFDAAIPPVLALPISRREQIVAVIGMYAAVTGFFALGPRIAELMGEELDFETDGPFHLALMQKYAAVTGVGDGS